jgi:adenosylmethionine---8-amino-7-oxononanoate aminotransferase
MSDWLEIDKKNIWHPFTSLSAPQSPLFIDSAHGIYLITKDGRKIIDGISSWWVNLHGHSHPYIAEVLHKQALKLEHVIFAEFTHEPAIKLSENLLSILPPNQRKIFFSDDGSTAVEVAIKLALQFWFNKGMNKKTIIAIRGAYHGDTFGAMSVAERSIFTAPFSSLLFNVDFIDFPFYDNEENCLQQFKTLVEKKDVAAFIFEPLIQAAAGMRMYRAAVLDRLITLAADHDIISIADEVFTGFGRTGKLFASDYLKNKPDIMCLSKGLTGGTLPLGVTSVSERIVDPFENSDFNKTFFHGHSYTANPLACAAANASFDLLMNTSCQRRIMEISSLQNSFAQRLKSNTNILDVRSFGTILAIELKADEPTSYANKMRHSIYEHFLSQDILLRPLGNIIYVVPPYIISNDELNRIHVAIEKFVTELK